MKPRLPQSKQFLLRTSNISNRKSRGLLIHRSCEVQKYKEQLSGKLVYIFALVLLMYDHFEVLM